MRRIIPVIAFLALMAPMAVLAQTAGTPNATVVTTCGTQTYPAGTARPVTQNTAGQECSAATVTASAAVGTNNSSTITLGGTFQQISAANTSRKSVDYQNRSGNGDACYLYFGTTAAANTAGITKAIKVADGLEYLRSAGVVPSEAVQTTCTTTADAFYEVEQ